MRYQGPRPSAGPSSSARRIGGRWTLGLRDRFETSVKGVDHQGSDGNRSKCRTRDKGRESQFVQDEKRTGPQLIIRGELRRRQLFTAESSGLYPPRARSDKAMPPKMKTRITGRTET